MRISDWSSDVCSSDLLLSTSEYSGKTASSDTGIAAVSLTEEGALSGLPVEMEVKQLANSQVLKSTTLADGSTTVGLGTLTLTTSAVSYDITIDSSNNTLDGLAKDINVADAGVTATILTDREGARPVLKGGGGDDAAITLT